MSQNIPWEDSFNAAVTIIGRDFTILYMNEKAAGVFARWGGRSLIGRDVRACHQEASVRIMERILETGVPNIYTIEKKGIKKLIYQAPWRKDGEIAGLVELSMELPANMPHYVRE